MEPKFKVGEVVRLKSGGPKMTIERQVIENPPNDLSRREFIGNYYCIFYDGTTLKNEKLHQDWLAIATDE